VSGDGEREGVMEKVTLTAEKREPGKGSAGRMRDAGTVPGVLYGKKVKPIPIAVSRRALDDAVKTKSGMNVMIDLSVKGFDSGLAFIRDYQADPFRREFTHVDFQAISMDEPIELEVPVVLTGESPGVKEGGVVVVSRRTLEIRALPDRIPEKIEVDIGTLMIGDSIHANDVTLPDGVEFPQKINYSIVAVVPPAKEEVAPVAVPVEGEAVPAEGAAPAAEGAAPAAEGAAPAAKGAAPAKGEAKPEAKGKGSREEKA
jgi:large subunit ribosomal protein L25